MNNNYYTTASTPPPTPKKRKTNFHSPCRMGTRASVLSGPLYYDDGDVCVSKESLEADDKRILQISSFDSDDSVSFVYVLLPVASDFVDTARNL